VSRFDTCAPDGGSEVERDRQGFRQGNGKLDLVDLVELFCDEDPLEYVFGFSLAEREPCRAVEGWAWTAYTGFFWGLCTAASVVGVRWPGRKPR
jgi:hypothetical protein